MTSIYEQVKNGLHQLDIMAIDVSSHSIMIIYFWLNSNIYDWLKTVLTDWTIIITGNSCSEYALSNWPAIGFTRNGVKQWLEEKKSPKT